MSKNTSKTRLNKISDRNRKLPVKQIIDSFILLKKANGIAERTESDYKKCLGSFFADANITLPEYTELKDKVINHFSRYSQKAPATYNLQYAYLNCFLEWCKAQGYIQDNPIKDAGIRKRKDTGKLRHMEEDVIRDLLGIIDLSTYSGFRDYAIIMLTLDTGIRPHEILSLLRTDIDLLHKNVVVQWENAKTRTDRVLPISAQTVSIIQRLLTVTPVEWDKYLFYTCEGVKMTVTAWWRRLVYHSRKLNTRVTPYMLRHSFAIYYLRNGGNVFALQKELGHTEIDMTKRYVNLTENDLKEQHKKASPVNLFVQRTTRVNKLFKDK